MNEYVITFEEGIIRGHAMKYFYMIIICESPYIAMEYIKNVYDIHKFKVLDTEINISHAKENKKFFESIKIW